MTKNILALAAAMAAFVTLTSPLALAQAQQTGPAVVTPVAQLPLLTPANVENELGKSDKPVFVLLTGAECGDLCSKLVALSEKYPQVKFMRGKGSDFGAPDKELPVVAMFVPGVGQTIGQSQFAPSDLDAFVAKRVEFAGKQMALVAKMNEIRKNAKDKAKPFDDEMAALQAQAEALMKPFEAESAAIRERLNVALKPINDQIATAEASAEAARKPFEDQIAIIRAERTAAAKPFNDEIAEIRGRQGTTLGALRQQYAAADEELQALIAKGLKEDSDEYKTAAAKVASIETEFNQKSEAFQTEIQAVQTKAAPVIKPFTDRINAEQRKANDAAKQFDDEVSALETKLEEASAPFETELAGVRTRQDEALKPLQEKFDAADTNKTAAVKDLNTEFRQARTELQQLVADDSQNAKN